MSASHRSLKRLPAGIFNKLGNRGTKEQGHPDDMDSTGDRLKQDVCDRLSVHQILTVGDLLQLSLPGILNLLDPLLWYTECRELQSRILSYCAPTPTTAKSLLDSSHDLKLPTGILALDEALKGGIRRGTVSELVGRAGVGKTQLALQMCIMAVTKLHGKCLYIDTEQKLNILRLQEMATERLRDSSHRNTTEMGPFSIHENQVEDEGGVLKSGRPGSTISPQQLLQHVLVYTPPRTTRSLCDLLASTVEDEMASSSEPVKLLVVDSIAAPARQQSRQQQQLLLRVAQQLKRFADQWKLAVVVTNQVSSSESSSVVAALGTSWHHCISTRIWMECQPQPKDAPSAGVYGANSIRRRASIVKSNLVGEESVDYQITMGGVVDMDPR